MQPVAEALAERNIRQAKDEQQTSCPQCGHLPLVGMIRDEVEVKGRRLLVCSLCATEWSFRRLTCPNCEENDPAKLSYHESETLCGNWAPRYHWWKTSRRWSWMSGPRSKAYKKSSAMCWGCNAVRIARKEIATESTENTDPHTPLPTFFVSFLGPGIASNESTEQIW